MRVNTRSSTRQRQARSIVRQGLTTQEKTTRRANALFVARLVHTRLERANKRQGVIRQNFNE